MYKILLFDWKDANEKFAFLTGHNCQCEPAPSLALWEARSVTSVRAKWSSCCEHKCWQVGQYVGRNLAFPAGCIHADKQLWVYIFKVCTLITLC